LYLERDGGPGADTNGPQQAQAQRIMSKVHPVHW
jgi:hypothetical protein